MKRKATAGIWKLHNIKEDGVVKTLHLLRCHKISIILKYLLYVEMIDNSRASKLKFFT